MQFERAILGDLLACLAFAAFHYQNNDLTAIAEAESALRKALHEKFMRAPHEMHLMEQGTTGRTSSFSHVQVHPDLQICVMQAS